MKETTRGWVILNILLPLLPIILRTFIKAVLGVYGWETVNAPELAFSLAIITLMINQDLLNEAKTLALPNEDRVGEINERAWDYFVAFIVLVALSCISEYAFVNSIIKHQEGDLNALRATSVIIYLLCIMVIWKAIGTKEEFKLKSRLR